MMTEKEVLKRQKQLLKQIGKLVEKRAVKKAHHEN